MAEFKYLTVVYRYINSDKFREFFQEQVSDRNCSFEGNKNALIQTTAWYDGDGLEISDNDAKNLKDDALSMISLQASYTMPDRELHAFGEGGVKMFEYLLENQHLRR